MDKAPSPPTPFPLKGVKGVRCVRGVSNSSPARGGGPSQTVEGAPPSVAVATATSLSLVDGETQMGRVQINPDRYFETDRIMREIILPFP
jgi:hypothetical protein